MHLIGLHLQQERGARQRAASLGELRVLHARGAKGPEGLRATRG